MSPPGPSAALAPAPTADALAAAAPTASAAPGAAPAEPRAVAAAPRGVVADYAELAKLRLSFLVLITTSVGYLWSTSPEAFAPAVFLATLAGTTLAAAGANALNQWLERDADARMTRTRNRPLPAGRLTPRDAVAFGVAAAMSGVLLLAAAVNLLTAGLALASVVLYVACYTPLKRRTPWNTWVGALPGALPAAMGATAASGAFDARAASLTAILLLWQLPHFYAIAWLYKDDYARGGFRMLSTVDPDGLRTARHSLVALVLLLPASLAPVVLGLAGPLYAVIAIFLFALFFAGVLGFARSRERQDARRAFLYSIVYLPLLLLPLVVERVPG